MKQEDYTKMTRSKGKTKTVVVKYKLKDELPLLKANMKKAKIKEYATYIRSKTLSEN